MASNAGPGRPVIGREHEIAVVSAFLDSLPHGPRALVLEGEAGIGKSTVWFEAVRIAEARGYRVLRARPAESEARLSYAALADLIGPAFDDARAQLPGPQELALAATLLRVASTEAVDPRTAATAVVGVLADVSRVCPVLIAIDDVQWVDLGSQRALEFAARRLPASLGLLVTRRSDVAAAAPLDLDRALPPDALQRIVLASLSLASLHHILRGRLGRPPTRPVIARVAEASGGNPFFAIEIAQALSTISGSGEHGPLPVPRSMQKLASERISALSGAARDAVLIAASLSRPTVDAIVATLPGEVDGIAAVLEAEETGILVTERGRVRFTHPLLASAVYGSVSDTARRALHLRLAEVVNDPEERAQHLSESITEPDESTAREIEDAAQQAVLRGAFDAAAELFAAACRLTPLASDDALVRRTLGQASALLRTGDVADARRLALAAEAGGLPPALQAERMQLLGEIEWDDGSIGLATNYLEQALDAARDDPARSARISARLVLIGVPGGPPRALQHAERAVRQVDAEREPLVLSSLLIDLCLLDLMLGRTPRMDLMERGLALELRAGPGAYPHPVPIIWFQCIDDVKRTRERYVRESEWARDHSDEAHAAERLSYLALAEFHAGNCDLGEQLIEQSCNIIEERLEVSGRFAYPFAWRSLIDAHRGRLDRASSTLRPLVAEAVGEEKSWWAAQLLGVLGIVEFVTGDLHAADHTLSQTRSLLDQIGIKDGLIDRTEPVHAELLVQLGHVDRAREILVRLEEKSRTFPRPWIDVTLPRARAVVIAAEGDVKGAIAACDSLDLHAAPRLPLEAGFTWLAKGRLYRRAKQRRAAADALREAVAIFERLGAVTWVDRARDELDLVGPRRRAPDELTVTELRVAELAATGITNREIARAVFMSEKTVEAHLARVYRKLGIRSRAELGAFMASNPLSSQVRT